MKIKALRFVAGALCCTMILALTACGEGTVSSSRASSASSSAVSSAVSSEAESSSGMSSAVSSEESSMPVSSTESSEAAKTAALPSGALSADIYSQQVEINGVVYTMPLASVQQLIDNGWATEKDLDFSIPSNTTTSGYTFKNEEGHQFVIQFANLTDSTQDVMNCIVYSISLSRYAAEKGISLILPGGVQIGSTYDEVIAACGTPDEEKEYDSNTTLKYGTQNRQKVEFSLDNESKQVKDIYLNFMYEAE